MNNSEKLTEEIERVLQSGGGSALFDREIVSVLLGAVHDRKQAQDVTKTLMDNCPGIGEILGREIDDLKMIEGMTEHAAAAIECVKEAYKRALREGLKRGPVMDSQEKLIEYVRVNIGFSAKEAVLIIYLDKQNRLIRDEVYFGTIDEVHLSERKVVKKALSMEAASIILSHNHPGGSLEPSEDDKVMTRELVSACQGVGIELEPVHNLFRSKAVKARTTICRLVLSFRSQFFHNLLHFSNQAKDRSITHLLGNTTKECNSFLFITSTVAPIIVFI